MLKAKRARFLNSAALKCLKSNLSLDLLLNSRGYFICDNELLRMTLLLDFPNLGFSGSFRSRDKSTRFRTTPVWEQKHNFKLKTIKVQAKYEGTLCAGER